MFSLEKMSAQALYPIVTGLFFFVFCFFNINLYELFIYFGYLPLVGHITCKYFSYYVGCPFVLLMASFAL